ncbi:hypothetical protein BDN72DRAFT_594921 [Pluteus cervinus]|uniref:Uncharacterized protein n=1 Tax=Pluteus cervinus TaxID=181527 RepID=A0ACD3AWB7_9AGAR|nr:hypothetical protein BDN72DRAFT_594921 [Pluteus cervinus]
MWDTLTYYKDADPRAQSGLEPSLLSGDPHVLVHDMEFRDQVPVTLSASQIHNTQYIQNTYSPAAHDDGPLKLLRDLQAPTAAFNSAGRCETLQCHEETRKVIKEHLTAWVDSDAEAEPSLKWIDGSVGVGKSAVAKWIASECTKKGKLAASFFFFRQGANHIGNFIPTIAYQIAVSHPIARDWIIAHIKNDPTILTKSLQPQWERLVVDPLASAQRPVLIVIDGIDEIASANEQTTLLRCILDTSRRSGLFIKILLISRPEPQICQEFDNFGLRKTSRISLGASKEDETDLQTFLTLSLNQVHKRRQQNGTMTRVPAPWPPFYELNTLVDMASRQFIYATTLITFIDDKNDDPVTKLDLVLKRGPGPNALGNLDYLYLMVMQRAKDETPKQDRHLLQKLLTQVLWHDCSSIFEIRLPPLATFWSTNDALIKITLGRLESVLTYKKSPYKEAITFQHRSFVDFLLNPSFPHPFVVGRAAFTVLAQRTLDLLGDPLVLDDDLGTLSIRYCASTLPTPHLVFRLAALGLRPWLLLKLIGHKPVESFAGYHLANSLMRDFLSVRWWMHSRPCLSMWLNSLLPLELVENSAYELLCHYPDERETDLLQQLVTSEQDPQGCRLLLNEHMEEYIPEPHLGESWHMRVDVSRLYVYLKS